jgi:NADH:ubiquinone oxidoreductase subunit 2 (subunit N)
VNFVGPDWQSGIVAAPDGRILLGIALLSLIVGAWMMARLQFSREPVPGALRYSMLACSISIVAFGAALVYGQAAP